MRPCSTDCSTTRVGPGWASASPSYRRRDGRAVRAVLESGCQEPVLVVTGGALGRGDRHRHRREPDDLRPVSAAAGGPRHRQSGRRRAGDVGGGRPSARGARGEVGVPARPRRPDRAGPARTASTSASASPRNRLWPKHFGSRASASTTWRRSTCTAASRSRSSRCATSSGWPPTIRAGSRSPVGCRTSAAPATATRCTASPRPSPRCATSRAHSASSAPTAAS